jgi:hypothetical protein
MLFQGGDTFDNYADLQWYFTVPIKVSKKLVYIKESYLSINTVNIVYKNESQNLMNSNPFFTSSAPAIRWLTLIEGLKELDVDLKVVIVGSYQSEAEQEDFEKTSHFNGIEFKYLTSKIAEGLWQRRYYKYIGKHIQFLKTKNSIHKELLNYEGVVWSQNDLSLWKIITSI